MSPLPILDTSASLGATATSRASTLPAIDQAQLPAEIRNGPPAARKAYATALAFEQVLVQQLSQAMTETASASGLSGDGSDASSQSSGTGDGAAATAGVASEYAQLLPTALTSGLMNAGGLGVARQLARAIDPEDVKL